MSRRSVPVLASVVTALHVSLVAAALLAPAPAITPPELPAMQVSLVMEQPPPATERSPEPPRPQPPPPPPPPPPPAEKAISDPALPPPPPPAPAAAAAPATETVAAPATPAAAPVVTAPKVNQAFGSSPPIVYPPLSRRLNETGTVLLHLHVLADGRIGEARVLQSSGFPRLDRAATEAALRWRLTPARRGNEPIAMWYEWPAQFELK